MLNPQHLIPAHGNLEMLTAYAELAEEEGYKMGNNIHILRNGQAQVLNEGLEEPNIKKINRVILRVKFS